ncbi:hypothetical protein INN71_02735 [Nocardioides sp. ChNu-153]|uniref:hypothetical protein n=1 Tax=Nocardioides sp. ChNu-153 TaxID=2779364 RepID=UPI00265225AC|nr:hypothetical protein [Nocardioides sp. ChNu-153]MDN7120302.1 hypothetical protein [Nocardioides sp. ChNu-153]
MTLSDLARDMRAIPPRAARDMREIVRDGVRAGATLSRQNAERTSGAHGKHAPKAISSEMHSGGGLFGNSISGEWGFDANKPQGGMSWETGSRNQPAHLPLAKAADIIGPQFAVEVHRATGRWYWL